MRGIVNAGILSIPTWLLIVTVIARPTEGVGDILVYTLLWALATLCAFGFILPVPERDDDGLPMPDVLRILPPAEPSDDWDRP